MQGHLLNEFTGLLPKVAGVNPGAFRVARDVTAFADTLPLLVLRVLDTANVRGPDVWVLFKDACGGDVRRFVLLVLQDPPADLAALAAKHAGPPG